MEGLQWLKANGIRMSAAAEGEARGSTRSLPPRRAKPFGVREACRRFAAVRRPRVSGSEASGPDARGKPADRHASAPSPHYPITQSPNHPIPPSKDGPMPEETPRPEYPRPQFTRKRWLNLNGRWQFQKDPGRSGWERGLPSA